MKQLIGIGLIGLLLTGTSLVWGYGSLAPFTSSETMKNNYGPRGKIISQTGEELYPAWPATFIQESGNEAGLHQSG